MKKLPEKKWLDRLLIPNTVEDIETYTAVKNIGTSSFISMPMALGLVLYFQIPIAFDVLYIYLPFMILSLIITHLGYHRLGRLMNVACISFGVTAWTQIIGPGSFAWLLLLNSFAGTSFTTAPDEKKLRLFIRGIYVLSLAVIVALYNLGVTRTSFDSETQHKISVTAVIIVLYCLGILYKHMMLYRREVEISKKLLESQAVAMLQQAKMSSLGEMAGGVAHEINNPLAMITGHMTQVLREMKEGRGSSEKAIEKGEKVLTTVTRISKIVSALRTFSRDAEGDPFQKSAWSEIIENTLNFCNENLRNNQVELKVSGDQTSQLECRSSQISQVLVNMITNSFDAIKDLPEKWIEIHSEKKENNFLITVTDSGHGIAPAVAEKIMQPFFTTKEIGKGTGLGLSVSKGIVEAHGGRIDLDRNSPHTRFVMTLPIDQKAPGGVGAAGGSIAKKAM